MSRTHRLQKLYTSQKRRTDKGNASHVFFIVVKPKGAGMQHNAHNREQTVDIFYTATVPLLL